MLETAKNQFRVLGTFWLLLSMAAFPGFGDGYTQAKNCVLLFFYCICCFQWCRIPSISSRLAVGMAGLGGFYLLSVMLNFPGPFGLTIIEWLGFFVATFTLLDALQAETGKARLLESMMPWIRFSLAITLIYQLIQESGFQPVKGLWFNDFPSALFGFQNMLAEFYGISLSAIWLSLAAGQQSKQLRWIDTTLLTLCMAALVTTISRTAYFSFGMLVLASFFLLARKKRPFAILACSLLVAIPLGYLLLKTPNDFVSFLLENKSSIVSPHVERLAPSGRVPSVDDKASLDRVADRILDSKSQTASTRLIRLKNSLHMIADYPFGVGPGNYEFGYMPYREKVALDPEANAFFVPRSPHNGYLELAIENGIGALFVLIVIIGIFIRFLLKNRKLLPEISLDHKWGLLLSIFLLSDALFAFPFEIPFPQYAGVLALALNISLLNELMAHKRLGELRVRFGLSLVSGLVIGTGCMALISLNASNWPKSFNQVQILSCRIFPEQWQSCLRIGYAALDRGDWQESYEIAKWSLRGRDDNFPAHLLLASASYLLHRDKELCQSLDSYKRATGDSMSVERLIGLDKKGSLPGEDNPFDDPCK